MQIGEVAERTGLSLRTIRYYEEIDLVVPSARSQGGFRLYTDGDVERLLLAKRMKPLEFSLDEVRGLFEVLDELAAERPVAEERRRELVAGWRCTATPSNGGASPCGSSWRPRRTSPGS